MRLYVYELTGTLCWEMLYPYILAYMYSLVLQVKSPSSDLFAIAGL